jgi:hypothetical protein
MTERPRFERSGFVVLDVLPQVVGFPLDETVWALVEALQPGEVRVILAGEPTKTDARCWRVTIYLDADERVRQVCQEVMVGLPDAVETGRSLAGLWRQRGRPLSGK